MAVDPEFRRHGVGRRLLAAAEAAARARAAGGGIYLHVERTNAGARSLYEQAGYVRLPDTAQHAAFTCALNVQHRDVRRTSYHGHPSLLCLLGLRLT